MPSYIKKLKNASKVQICIKNTKQKFDLQFLIVIKSHIISLFLQ